jgi:acetylornithine deacetylase/succinyl-diaminopimelate desuccinylase-like protein
MTSHYLRQHRARFVRELQQLVRFPSISAQPKHRGDLLACAKWLAGHFRKIGLSATIHKTAGHPIIEATLHAPRSDAPTVVIYGHYDVQPPEPLDLWKTPPFGAVVRAGKMYGRGASDNKGQFFAHVKAVEALLAAGRSPVNVTFLIEGEEEVGSEALMEFCRQHSRRLRADYIVISDGGMYAKGQPAIAYATRGIAALEVRVDGPNRDLHSGVFGGSVANPVLVLSKLLASCTDNNGRVIVPGFYDDVLPLTARERKQFAALPFDERAYARQLGVPALTGERGFTTIERRWARPTFEVNGITGGYQGPGGKTIVPAWASAKITCRLVSNQSAGQIIRLVSAHLRKHCPPTVRLTIFDTHEAEPFCEPPTGPGARAAAKACEQAFGRQAVFIREGGTLPILSYFKRYLRGEIIAVGLGLNDDNWHSPNEKMDLDNFHRGIAMSVELLRRLALRLPGCAPASRDAMPNRCQRGAR